MPGMRNKRDRLYSCLCCSSATGFNRSKTAEKREWSQWADEYEDAPAVVDHACLKGGPDCGCHHYGAGETDIEIPSEGVYSIGC